MVENISNRKHNATEEQGELFLHFGRKLVFDDKNFGVIAFDSRIRDGEQGNGREEMPISAGGDQAECVRGAEAEAVSEMSEMFCIFDSNGNQITGTARDSRRRARSNFAVESGAKWGHLWCLGYKCRACKGER